MESRLKFCSIYLKEVEGKLINLRVSVGGDPDARVKVSEALNFVKQARTAISEIQIRIGDLQRARTHLTKRRLA